MQKGSNSINTTGIITGYWQITALIDWKFASDRMVSRNDQLTENGRMAPNGAM
jgi:hypothetical protein